ncbi:hypothetical protein PFICI_04083 [Pestalotiopsis fici W106-1]|uniref:Uncharacterized protein n=1 Tax=Pestalotiopsis fici (strain W106-1 / CGMCC3.15140) TaxID=1229662 RepID=W3XJ15_PESFW|nr:uncharacterized protein PFICI_04083 [Pestalotiopsis fici W106-1]ETS86058.1 hypothetical protein PFICI_04083 [Pestalotiopsis fici W106-1]
MIGSSALAVLLLASTFLTGLSAQNISASVDQPNPIAQMYPDLISGNLNGTTMIIPIAIAQAQSLVPEYPILESVYTSLLPTFPAGMYPLVVTVKHDHDIQLALYNLSLADFTRAAFEFPFLDLSGDGATPFRLQKTILITASNQIAIEGAQGYDITAYPANFDPPNDAYRSDGDSGTYFSANGVRNGSDIARYMTIATQSTTGGYTANPYPFDFIKNITNQVTFAASSLCDDYQLLYNTSLTAAPFEPKPVIGTVTALLEPFDAPQSWTGVYGWQYAAAFLEPVAPAACPSAKR